MPQTFETKVRMVGTSLGVLIPKEVVKEENLKAGEMVEIALIKHESERKKLIEKYFGIAKGAAPFHREHKDREF